jgi:prepilin-type processing-associated H-X9-DG protein
VYEPIAGFGWPGGEVSDFHSDLRINSLFCDGHVETNDPNRIPKIAHSPSNTPIPFPFRFKADANYARRWNTDNQPHPETWPGN